MFHPAGSLLKKALVPAPASIRHALGPKSASLIKTEAGFSAPNYHPMPCVFSTAKGAMVRDADGKLYVDFLAGYGAVNHGHLHPAIVKAAKKQLDRCTLSSRAFYSDTFGAFAKKVTSTFRYSSMLPMNTGAEAVETAIKLARRWGYKVKGIRPNKAIIICCDGCFHGRTLAAISMSDDPSSYDFFGPLVPGFIRIPYGDSAALEAVLKKHGKNVAGFLVEPIQGEAGVMIPPAGFFKKARALCTKHKVLLMADEVQAGVGRTGKLLAIQHEGVRPDVVVMAKALGGGILPVAAVLADKKIMNVFEPGTHGSTFGGNPLASAVGIAALDALKSDKIVEQSAVKGKQLAAGLKKLHKRFPHLIHAVRCRGLWGAIETKHDLLDGHAGKKLAMLMLKRFVLAKVTHDHTIRLSPPLVITPAQLQWSLARIAEALEELETMVGSKTTKLAAPAKKAAKKKLLPVSVKKAQKKIARKKKGGKKH